MVCCQLSAQHTIKITGTISDSSSKKLAGTSILLYREGDQYATVFSFSDNLGRYSLTIPNDTDRYVLHVNMLGYHSQQKELGKIRTDHLTENFILNSSDKILDSVIVKDERNFRIHKDTIEYIADSFRTVNTIKIQDLLRSIDGFTVDNNGKIAYRGKEVSALLFNGDDIAGDLYGLVNKNVTSDVVDKVQVFENYQKNRIVGTVIKSDDIAVNLKLNKKISGKLNGNASLGYSPAGKGHMDLNSIYYKPSFQYIQLFEGNNYGNFAASAFSPGRMQSSTTGFFDRKLTEEAVPVFHTIQTPSISENYVYHNKDLMAAPYLHFRINKHQKLAIRLAGFAGQETRRMNSFINQIISEQKSWQIHRQQFSELHSEWLRADVQWSHDNGKKLAGDLNLHVYLPKTNMNFNEIASGDLIDSLRDNSKNSQGFLGLDYNAAYQLGDKKILKFSSSIFGSARHFYSTFSTERFNDFFHLTGSNQFAQKYDDVKNVYHLDLSYIEKRKTYSLRSGIQLNTGFVTLEQQIDVQSHERLIDKTGKLITEQFSVYNIIAKTLSSQTKVELYFKPGLSRLKIPGKNSKSIFDYILNLDLNYKYKPFSSLSFQIKAIQKLPANKYFLQDSLLTSSVVYLSPGIIKPINYIELDAGLNKFKLIKNQSFAVSGWIKMYGTNYSPTVYSNPDIATISYTASKNELEYGITSSVRSYVPALKSTFGFAAFFQQNFANEIVNNLETNNRYSNLNVNATYISQFKLPVKIEVDPALSYSTIDQRYSSGKRLDFENLSYQVKVVITYQITSTLYAGFLLNWYKQDFDSFLQSDFNCRWIINKKWSASLKIFNLFNNQNFVRKQIGTNFSGRSEYEVTKRFELLSLSYSF